MDNSVVGFDSAKNIHPTKIEPNRQKQGKYDETYSNPVKYFIFDVIKYFGCRCCRLRK
jgi:hypothetical protein